MTKTRTGEEVAVAKTPEEVYVEKLEKIVQAAVKPDFDKVATRFDGLDTQLAKIQSTLKIISETLKK